MRKPANRGKRFPLKTQQQRVAVTLITAALRANKPFSTEELLVKAGYSPESARQRTNIMQSLRPHIDPIVARLEAHRERVMQRMEATVDRADYADLSRSMDVLTRNIRLLTGKSTHNFALEAEHRHRIEALLTHE